MPVLITKQYSTSTKLSTFGSLLNFFERVLNGSIWTNEDVMESTDFLQIKDNTMFYTVDGVLDVLKVYLKINEGRIDEELDPILGKFIEM